ncbi:DUF2971 domain-containing protein [Alteromonas portus]|uniref:DUF2971 domain-containing protein n=1 Tax=Alteromonas portus TaxID=2565549 RepID=UPI003BF8B950
MFHYTDANALLSIIQNQELWLTDVRYMNDSQEYIYGLSRLLKKIQANDGYFGLECLIREVTHSIPNFEYTKIKGLDDVVNKKNKNSAFSMSFCEDGNLLSQWRGYTANTVGYAIEFDVDELIQELDNSSLNSYQLLKCIYDESEHEKAIDKIIESLELNVMFNIADKILYPITRLKHYDFKEEQETRLAIITNRDINYRVVNGIFRPFIKLKLNNIETLIKSITIGPHEHSILAKESLEEMLNSHFSEGSPKVNISQTPYRLL